MTKIIYNPPRIKRKKKNSFFKKIILLRVVPSFLVFGVIFYFLFFYSYFEIKEVRIAGLKTISEDILREKINMELSKKIYFFAGQNNLFLFPAKKIKASFLKGFPKMKEISIRRALPNLLEIEIAEREAVAIWCDLASSPQAEQVDSSQSCFFIDGEGIIFESAPLVQGNLIFKVNDGLERKNIMIGEEVLAKDFMSGLFRSKGIFEEGLGAIFPEFSVLPENILEAKSSLGWKIIFDSSFNFDSQIQALKKILDEIKPEEKEKLEYFDLRIKGRIYYK